MFKATLPLWLIEDHKIKDLSPSIQTHFAWTSPDRTPGDVVVSTDDAGQPNGVWVCVKPEMTLWDFARLPSILPSDYAYSTCEDDYFDRLVDGWLLAETGPLRLVLPDSHQRRSHMMSAYQLVRSWVNEPPNIMHSEKLAQSIERLAQQYDGCYTEWRGAALKQAFPMVDVVGRASEFSPVMTQVQWAKPNAKKLVIIGKGVCFDSGGLDIKPSTAMKLMKKDMGGAAHAAALASWLVASHADWDITLLVPCVDNMISGRSFRVGDVLTSRSGQTVEVGNTDAEGRLVLADALSYADTLSPDLIIDFATLTGAARVALGHDIPAYFSSCDQWSERLEVAAKQQMDPVWRMPLYQPYRSQLESDVADIHSTGSTGLGGAITAALFLHSFVSPEVAWMHFDVHAYHLAERPGRPKGGGANALRSCFSMLV